MRGQHDGEQGLRAQAAQDTDLPGRSLRVDGLRRELHPDLPKDLPAGAAGDAGDHGGTAGNGKGGRPPRRNPLLRGMREDRRPSPRFRGGRPRGAGGGLPHPSEDEETLPSGRKTLFIVCGEPSGETYAVRVARAFRKRFPLVPMEGIGSARLANEGVRLLLDYGEISVVGMTEGARHLPAIVRAPPAAVRRATRPDVGALLLVDFPDFNYRVGKKVNKRGIPVIYYIPPQLWAWRAGRAEELARFTRGVVVPFPFEEPILREKGGNGRFAGHPLLDELRPYLDASADPGRFGIPAGKRLRGGGRRGPPGGGTRDLPGGVGAG